MSKQTTYEPSAVRGVAIYDQLLLKLHGIAVRCRHLAEHTLEPEVVPTLRQIANDMEAAMPRLEERVRACFDVQPTWLGARTASAGRRRVH